MNTTTRKHSTFRVLEVENSSLGALFILQPVNVSSSAPFVLKVELDRFSCRFLRQTSYQHRRTNGCALHTCLGALKAFGIFVYLFDDGVKICQSNKKYSNNL